MGLCESCLAGGPGAGKERRTIYAGPTSWLTSNGFKTDTQWVRFIQTLLKRRGVLQPGDESEFASRQDLITKYAAEIKKLRVTFINDASFHRDELQMHQGRVGPDRWFWWDIGLREKMGVPKENITMIQILEKPWLFNRSGRLANRDKQQPNVADLDPEDEKRYFAALQLTQDAYNALKEDPPKVGAGQANGFLPGCPDSSENCADALARISVALNDKYADAFDKWCNEYISGADLVCGQGGEVVMLNMAWACNQKLSARLVSAVKEGKTTYCGLSASSMVAAHSIEMTGEIQPGWIEAFSVDPKYFSRNKFFKMEDLMDGDGTAVNVVGALPLCDSPWAIRPHYKESWEAMVYEKNLIAEAEFEREMHVEVDDQLVASSKHGLKVALKLLNIISANSKDQDHPVFVPMYDADAVEVNFYDNPYREVFAAQD